MGIFEFIQPVVSGEYIGAHGLSNGHFIFSIISEVIVFTGLSTVTKNLKVIVIERLEQSGRSCTSTWLLMIKF
jgi:hypothetical protein